MALFVRGADAADFDLTPWADTTTPLANPHKGWYHHFPDNHLTARYPIRRDEDLLNIPGMDHLYMRLAWAYLEPSEGKFAWDVIDGTIAKWTGKGLGIAFRISCRETGTDRIEQQFATPRWVIDGRSQGRLLPERATDRARRSVGTGLLRSRFPGETRRVPASLCRRYDGQPWLRYVDIGSIGDWGEGHTHSGSRQEYGFDIRKRHIDLHLKYFTKTPLVVSDDYIYSVSNLEDRQRLHRYVLDHGITYRDDSILVNGYIAGHTKTWTVRSPEFFADAYRKTPTIFELEHYSAVKRTGQLDRRTRLIRGPPRRWQDRPRLFPRCALAAARHLHRLPRLCGPVVGRQSRVVQRAAESLRLLVLPASRADVPTRGNPGRRPR